ncbi:DeoR/GlpR transcriptional regulator [Acinetobacter sp. B5B]|uniref:DeoR/GlpR family DNA-binding transcription regulator n=1 Tax=Acinetobacter baretiae TaxID=2605383 RepID=UPI0018C255E5|nr:DeoR/GlpR family DNA-binding transcription regulator [Acinetobacter baretiae]MBF7682881.1 DeoR/GlpR transcriptional regulator [Acinetobacter baretiae]MBF7684847.1 DeoR/GlpR transcriptional regulator [Acinetobacter baretiae]
MLQQERLHRIHTLLLQVQQMSTERIMQELSISRETARRDMITLENTGQAKRVHGGIICVHPSKEAPLNVRYGQMIKEKRAIAKAAIQLLNTGQTIFIDAGSTTAILAEELRTLSGLTIITNSLQVILNLSAGEGTRHHLILLGGEVTTQPQTHGDQTISEIYRYHADVALLSPAGIDPSAGATNYQMSEANIAKAMIQQSQSTFILADERKIHQVSRIQYAQSHEIDVLITNQSKNTLQIEALLHQFKQVILA